MELAFTLGLGGWILLVVGALVFGGVAQFIGEARTGYEWLVDAVGAGIGALIGGLIVGVIVELATRYATGGTYTAHRPMSA